MNNLELIITLTKRYISDRYRGSFLGILWAIISPASMLAIYTFVFSVVFKIRWSNVVDTNSNYDFALLLFIGLMIFNLFSDCVNQSSNIYRENVNYVKKVIFPLEILPVVVLLTSLFNFFICFMIWVFAFLILNNFIHIYTLIFPLILLPHIFLILGISYFVSSVGVYIRDLSPLLSLITTILLFISPIFYPLSKVPESLLKFILLNPIATTVEMARSLLYYGELINFSYFIINLLVSILIFIMGYNFFIKTKSGFADEL